MRNADEQSTQAVIIVGASSGIGRSLACALGREGARVAVVGRRVDALERVAYEVGAFGGSAIAIVSDTRDQQSIAAAVERITEEFGRIDTAILSQGIAPPMVDMDAFHAQPVREALETNVMGVAYWLEALHPVLVAQASKATPPQPSPWKGEGVSESKRPHPDPLLGKVREPESRTEQAPRDTVPVVAVVSSLSQYRAIAGPGAAYSSSKAAISQLCDGLRAVWRRQGIRLVTVEPGFIRTPMTAALSHTPLLMEPEDAARVILDGIRRGDPVIRFPRLAAFTMATIGMLPPRWLDRLYRP